MRRILIPGDSGRGHARNVNRDSQFAGDDLQARDVIGMLAQSNENRGQRFGIVAGGFEALESFLAGESGVDEETGALGGNQRGIAGTRRRENRNFNDGRASSRTKYYYSVVRGKRAKVGGVVYDRSMKARVFVSPKTTVLDPQGQAIRGALNGLGHRSITEVRQGKIFEVELSGPSREAAAREKDQKARDVHSNPQIEDYRVEFFD